VFTDNRYLQEARLSAQLDAWLGRMLMLISQLFNLDIQTVKLAEECLPL